ncbi:MAG: response regulator [Sneathiellaceae bacterium]
MPAYDFGNVAALVVDDAYNMRRLLGTILTSLGIRKVYSASDGAEALTFLQQDVDVVFLDYLMEPMDGMTLTRRIRDEQTSPTPFVPIVMVTGHATPETVHAARQNGVTEFLVKPVSVKTVAARLTAVIDHPRPFVRQTGFFGPDRRRRVASFQVERRGGKNG